MPGTSITIAGISITVTGITVTSARVISGRTG